MGNRTPRWKSWAITAAVFAPIILVAVVAYAWTNDGKLGTPIVGYTSAGVPHYVQVDVNGVVSTSATLSGTSTVQGAAGNGANTGTGGLTTPTLVVGGNDSNTGGKFLPVTVQKMGSTTAGTGSPILMVGGMDNSVAAQPFGILSATPTATAPTTATFVAPGEFVEGATSFTSGQAGVITLGKHGEAFTNDLADMAVSGAGTNVAWASQTSTAIATALLDERCYQWSCTNDVNYLLENGTATAATSSMNFLAAKTNAVFCNGYHGCSSATCDHLYVYPSSASGSCVYVQLQLPP